MGTRNSEPERPSRRVEGVDCGRPDGSESEGRSDDEVGGCLCLVGVGAFGPLTSYIRVRRCWAISFSGLTTMSVRFLLFLYFYKFVFLIFVYLLPKKL